jgi:predicted negative regulator of RcsB-dependent stress response
MAKKITKKELTQPDFFQLSLAKTTEYISGNKTRIYIISSVVAATLLLSAGWYFYQTNHESNAQAHYAKAHLAALKGGPADGQIGENVLKIYQDVVIRYPGTKAALMAQYRIGNLYYRMNDLEASMKAYQEFLKGFPKDNELKTLAYIGLGYCFESKNDYKNALESFENAANTKSAGSFEGLNFSNIARIHAAMNNREKAIEYYQKALGKTSDSAAGQLIKRKISSLG